VSAPPRPAVVFAAAPLRATPRLKSRLAALEDPFVVAADGGARTALAFGMKPSAVIGDLDSIDARTLQELLQQDIALETYPRDKDATDGYLAVQRALQIQPGRLVLLGYLGGSRLDQALANVFLLVSLDAPTILLDEHNECTLLRPGADHVWRPEPRELVSLLPLGGPADGIQTQGLRWALRGERLPLGTTRGVSNEPVAAEARVSIERGLLLVTRHFHE
jgi:thiamine pyrophosphokinase